MNTAKVIILGASPNPARYSNKAAIALHALNYTIVPVGLKSGEVSGKIILDIRTMPFIDQVDTITMYMNARNQQAYYDYIFSLKPRRIIFNPGAKNDQLAKMAEDKKIKVVNDCTLLMLSSGYF
jgi:predicted CoA-binding protein